MAVENVVCPHCGNEALATVPSGAYLVKTDTDSDHWKDYLTSQCSCSRCGGKFYSHCKWE